MATQNFVFDGVTTIDSDPFDVVREWDDRRISYLSFWNGDELGPHQVNISLTDAAWSIHTLRFSGEGGIRVNMTDAATGDDRTIRNIEMSDAGGTVTVDRTRIESITSDGSLSLTTGRHRIDIVDLRDGDDTVNIGAGGADYVDVSGGDNSVTVRDGGRIRFLHGSEGNTDVTLTGDSRIYMVKLDGGTNSMTTGTGFVESFFSHEGTNTLTIGTGGIGAIQFYGNDERQVVSATGWVGSLTAGDDIRSVVTLGAGGAGAIQTADGADTIRTGTGFVSYIGTRGGDDTLDLGSGTVGAARLQGGDDTLILRSSGPDNGSFVHGGDGIDTVDLSRIGTAVSLDLSEVDWQEVASGRGFVRLSNFENIIGGNRGDRLAGDDGDNVLTGGRGNDTLTGNDGIDTFVFGRNTGRDAITDFEAGVDLIDIAGASRLTQLRFFDTGDEVEIRFGRARITIEDATIAEIRDADNFLF